MLDHFNHLRRQWAAKARFLQANLKKITSTDVGKAIGKWRSELHCALRVTAVLLCTEGDSCSSIYKGSWYMHAHTHTHTCTAAFEDLLRHSSVAPEVREETEHPPLYKSYSVEDVATEKPSDMVEVKQPSTPK